MALDKEFGISRAWPLIGGQAETPLPALPLPTGAKVVGFGHSQVQRGWFSVTGSPGGILEHQGKSDSLTRAVLPWIALMDARFNLDVLDDLNNPFRPLADLRDDMLNGAAQAIGGDSFRYASAISPGFLTRAAHVTDRAPQIVYFHGPSNDIAAFRSANDVAADCDTLLRQMRQAGCYVVLQTNPTRSFASWPQGDVRRAELHKLNDWIKAQAGRPGVFVCDTTDLFADPPDPSLLLDGVHFSPLGAYAVAQRLLPILQSLVAPGSHFDPDPTAGNLLPNSDLSGTAGTKTPPAQVSGTVATGWGVAVNGGASLVYCSTEPDDLPGRYVQHLDITPVLATGRKSDEIRINRTAHLSLTELGLAEGDAIEIISKIDLTDSPIWRSVGQSNSFYAGTTSRWQANTGLVNPNYEDAPLPRGALTFWTRTRTIIPVGRGITTLRWAAGPISVRIDPRYEGQVPPARLSFRRPKIHKIPDPRTAWRLL